MYSQEKVYTIERLARATRILTSINFFCQMCAPNRQTEGARTGANAACLSGRQPHFSKVQYTNSQNDKL